MTEKKKVNNKIQKQFGLHVKQIREEQALSLRETARNCDLDDSNISKIEHGRFDVRLSTIVELAKGLGVRPSRLLDYDLDS